MFYQWTQRKRSFVARDFSASLLLRSVAKAIPAIVIELVRLAKDVHLDCF
jgi:hypothetical protein